MNNEKMKILYVDDEPANLKTFEIGFKKDYNIICFSSAETALKFLEDNNDIALIIADHRMPGMTGIEFLEKSIAIIPDSIRILLTAYTETEDFLNAINSAKVYNYIVKPWKKSDVSMILKEGCHKYSLILENKNLVSELHKKIDELKKTQYKLLDQEKKAFIASLLRGLIHEVNNQLSSLTYLDIIKEDLSEDKLKYINYIYDSRTRIINLFNEIRSLARGESAHYALKKESLNQVVKESLSLIKLDPDVKPIKIIENYGFNGEVLINKDKIIQVIFNLIRNASHAAADINAGRITVTTLENGKFAQVSVKDNGTGIKKDELEKIWEPFFTTKGDKGTGIGLEICKRIIEGHNGKIECMSDPGKETVFTFTLPLAE